ncbi:MAG: TIGR00266 family protein [Desulfurococcales archaeon]|nr:TIGR00266 family protein [Desulfurococcales archaeon]
MVEWVVEKSPAYSVLKVRLGSGEQVTAEAGAMMLMKGDIQVKTTTGGIKRGLLRKLAGGESMFMNIFQAGHAGGEVWFVPPVPGDIKEIKLSGESWIVQDTSYLAHTGNINVGVAWRGMKGLFAEGELVWLKLEGTGTVWVNSYGAIETIQVPAGDTVIVDNMHFVAMPSTTNYEITKFGGLKSFLLGGEGIVAKVYGPTTLLVQTRVLPPLARLLQKYLPRK